MLQTSAKLQSASESPKERHDRHALLQAYHSAGRMGLHPNGRGPERASDCAVGVSYAASRQRVAEKEYATARKGGIPSNLVRPERRRRADAKQRQKERSLTMRPW
jgi:hypothetical protein